MSDNDALTICTVYHSPASKRLLEMNYALTARLNPRAIFRWIGGNNMHGIKNSDLAGDFLTIKRKDEDLPPHPQFARISYDHTLTLNELIPHAQTRFLLVLDPDFFIIEPEWISTVISRMKSHDLAFFGSVWHPRFYPEYRYFPSHHCLFIDLDRIDRASLDFLPDYTMTDERHRTFTDRVAKHARRLPYIGKRMGVGTSRDTTYRIYKRYAGNDTIKFEYLTPVFTWMESNDRKGKALWWATKISELALPERFSLIPKKRGYYTRRGFASHGYPDIDTIGWEEHMWNDIPFGFHIRGTHKLADDVETNLRRIQEIIDTVADRASHATS
jgi:hypothetical protein